MLWIGLVARRNEVWAPKTFRCGAMAGYYDIDAILMEQELLPCTFHQDVRQMGFLQVGVWSADVVEEEHPRSILNAPTAMNTHGEDQCIRDCLLFPIVLLAMMLLVAAS